MDQQGETKIKYASCRFCSKADLHWEIPSVESASERYPTGRWLLMEPYGLPHSCEEKEKFFKEKRDKESDAKKQQYYAEKQRLHSIPDGGPCPRCNGRQGGAFSYAYSCYACGNTGKMSAKARAYMLLQARKNLWPSMFNKGKKG